MSREDAWAEPCLRLHPTTTVVHLGRAGTQGLAGGEGLGGWGLLDPRCLAPLPPTLHMAWPVSNPTGQEWRSHLPSLLRWGSQGPSRAQPHGEPETALWGGCGQLRPELPPLIFSAWVAPCTWRQRVSSDVRPALGSLETSLPLPLPHSQSWPLSSVCLSLSLFLPLSLPQHSAAFFGHFTPCSYIMGVMCTSPSHSLVCGSQENARLVKAGTPLFVHARIPRVYPQAWWVQ